MLKIYIHTHAATLRSIILSGYQPGGGNRCQAGKSREGWERKVCPTITNWVKPSYGAVGYSPLDTHASHYGKVALKLSSEMNSVSTWTQGDSQIQDGTLKEWPLLNEAAMMSRGDSFVEAQVWAEVDRSNIEEIIYLEGIPSEDIKQLCELLNIPLHWMERDYTSWEWVAHQI